MIAPVISTSFKNEMLKIDPGLFVIWDSYFERFQIMHRCPKTGIVRCIVMVEDDDGGFRQCDNRTLDYLKERVSFETLKRFPRPEEMGRFMREQKEKIKADKENQRSEERKLWNREHKKYWKAALENLRRGVIASPPRTKKTITIAPGLSPKDSHGAVELGLFD